MNNQVLKSRHHCIYCLNYHLVLVTKYRRPCLTDDMIGVIQQMGIDRAKDWDGEMQAVNGSADHVHFLLSLPPHHAISDFVNMLKTNTSRLLRRDFKELLEVYSDPVLWSRSYCVISAGGASLDILRKYIEDQKTNG